MRRQILLLFAFSIFLKSCAGQTANDTNIEKIYKVFNQWKKDVINDSTYLEKCPTTEEFESINDSVRREKLMNAHILPKTNTVSFGDFNGDNKQDALFSFPDYICYGFALGALPAWLINRPANFILITSNFEGYKITTKEIDDGEVSEAIRKSFKASGVSLSFTQIEGKDLISGTCKIWSDENSDSYLGLCCPDKLFFFTVDTYKRKISTYINEGESQSFDIAY